MLARTTLRVLAMKSAAGIPLSVTSPMRAAGEPSRKVTKS